MERKCGGGIVGKICSSVVVACIFLFGADIAGAAALAAKQKAQSKTPALIGLASVYAYKKRSRSASGEILNFKNLVAAHRTLRFGTQVRVTNRKNGKSVVVRIIDRGPFVRGRVIDLSPAAAREIGLGWGLAPVTLAVVANKA
jgi:rare lipoprotein A